MIVCEQCGTTVELYPCPKCGCVPTYEARANCVIGGVQMSATGSSFTYPEWLLQIAQGLIDNGHYEPAIVVAAMACEISTEAVISAALKKKHAPLSDVVASFFSGYSFSHDRTRRLYTALTGDAINDDNPFLNDYLAAVPVARNSAIHKGERFSKQDAEKALKLASQMLNRLSGK